MKTPSKKQDSRSLPAEAHFLSQSSSALYEGRPLSGPNGLLTQLIKQAVEAALEGELDAHLAEASLEEGANRRNGFNKKT